MTKWIHVLEERRRVSMSLDTIESVWEVVHYTEAENQPFAALEIYGACASGIVAAGNPAPNRKKAEEKRLLTAEMLTREIDRIRAGKPQAIKLYGEKAPENIQQSYPAHYRGKWAAGTLYVDLDIAQHPADNTKHYVCVGKHQSTDASVLDDKRFWSPIKLPGAA